jgi:hypothetical protein
VEWARLTVPPRHDITADEEETQGVREHGIEAERAYQEPRRRSSLVRKKNQLWTEEDMRAALEDFDSGMSMKNSVGNHGIPYSTFREWYYGKRTWRCLES